MKHLFLLFLEASVSTLRLISLISNLVIGARDGGEMFRPSGHAVTYRNLGYARGGIKLHTESPFLQSHTACHCLRGAMVAIPFVTEAHTWVTGAGKCVAFRCHLPGSWLFWLFARTNSRTSAVGPSCSLVPPTAFSSVELLLGVMIAEMLRLREWAYGH